MKRLGQHILVNDEVARRQASYANLNDEDIVLEIGGGKGILTKILSERCKKIYVIELDRKYERYLINIGDNVEVIWDDALKLDFPKFTKIVSNIPFYISTDLTFKIMRSDFKIGVIMYQWEFAKRLCGSVGTKDYSRITVMAHIMGEWNIVEKVGRKNFRPIPNVDAAIVKVVPRDCPFEIKNMKIFEKVVETAFLHRRKKLKNALKRSWTKICSKKFEDVIDKLPYTDRRPDKISPKEYAEISNIIYVECKD